MPRCRSRRGCALPLCVALGFLFAVALTHRVRDTIDRFAEVVHGDELPRLPFDLDFPGSCVTLDPGDVLVAFTDGVSEAMDAGMSEWGEERLEAVVRAQRSQEPRALIEGIIAGAAISSPARRSTTT